MDDQQTQPADAMQIPEDQVVANLEAKAQEHFTNWQRSVADYQNLKKQNEKDRQEVVQYAVSNTVLAFTPIYDNLKRAVKHIPAEQLELDWVKGVTHIIKQFEDALQLFSIELIPTIGQPFDHAKHHAVSKMKKEGVATDTILEEVKSGFIMGGKVIEPAQVVVAE